MGFYLNLFKSKTKPIRRNLLYYNGLIYFEVIKKIPAGWFEKIGNLIGFEAYHLFYYERNLSVSQLKKYLKVNEKTAKNITKEMFCNFAKSFLELFNIEKLISDESNIQVENIDILMKKYQEGKGVILVSGHIGNWELLVSYFANKGLPITVIMRSIYDDRLNKVIIDLRNKWGIESIIRGDSSALGKMKSVLKNKRVLGLLIDQDTNVPGVFAPFMGEPAYTPKAPAQLSLRFDIPVIFAYTYRVGNKKHNIVIEDISYARTGDEEKDILELTTILNKKLENAIKSHPEQWVWHHRRWKTKEE